MEGERDRFWNVNFIQHARDSWNKCFSVPFGTSGKEVAYVSLETRRMPALLF